MGIDQCVGRSSVRAPALCLGEHSTLCAGSASLIRRLFAFGNRGVMCVLAARSSLPCRLCCAPIPSMDRSLQQMPKHQHTLAAAR